jgi:hypothetical protein
MVAMSNNQDWYDDDDDFEFDDEQPQEPQRNSNDVLKKVRRAERAKEKRIKELESELESLRKFQRESTVSKVLSEKGVNPKIAAFIPQDLEPTADAVSSWLEQYGDVFGVVKQEAPSVNVNPEDLSALRQIDVATSGAISPDNVNDAFSIINNAASAEELMNFLYSQGAE